MILCWNKCYYTYESPSFLLLSTLFENASRKQQGEKIANEISKICLHQKSWWQRKSWKAFIKLPKFNLFPFLIFKLFTNAVKAFDWEKKCSIVEIQIPPKSWELGDSVRYKVFHILGGRKILRNVLFMFLTESSIRIRRGPYEAENETLSINFLIETAVCKNDLLFQIHLEL